MDTTPRPTTRQRTIVVGVDGSAGSARAVRWSALEAAATGARIRLVSAWDIPNTAWPAMAATYIDPAEISRGAHAIIERAEHDARRVLGGQAVAIEGLAPEGGPAEGLLGACGDADLLVVGTRGRGGFVDLVLGSVAQTCAHHTRLPLVVIGREYTDPGAAPIVVGVDESEGARRALDWAVAEAGRLGTHLRVLHGWEVCRSSDDGPPVVHVEDDPDVVEDLRRWYAELTVDAIARVGTHVDFEVDVVGPSPVPALIEASKTASLVVVGSRGRGTFRSLLLGSVSQQSVQHSSCPVVVVPHPHDD